MNAGRFARSAKIFYRNGPRMRLEPRRVNCFLFLRSGGENSVHFFGKPFQTVRAVCATLLRDAPAIISNFVECLHHRGPVVVALEELDIEPLPQTLLVGLVPAEFL